MTEDSKKWLQSLLGDSICFDQPMAPYTSFRVGGPADALVVVDNLNILIELVTGLHQRKLPFWVIGRGTNLVVKDHGIRGVVIVLKKAFENMAVYGADAIVKAKAGAPLARLCRLALENGLAGMNFALGIPGTVGGGIVTNAGTSLGNVGNVLKDAIFLFPDGTIKCFDRQQMQFSYRQFSLKNSPMNPECSGSIILEGTFCLVPDNPHKLRKEAIEIVRGRKKNQPSWLPSAGCFFKNPGPEKSAGQLIDQAGLKGKRWGGAEVSTRHANFIINRENASAGDIIALMKLIQETVWKKFNICLEPEVTIIGE